MPADGRAWTLSILSAAFLYLRPCVPLLHGWARVCIDMELFAEAEAQGSGTPRPGWLSPPSLPPQEDGRVCASVREL